MIKSLIFYGARTKLTRMHVQVAGAGSVGGRWQPQYYVRTDVINGDCAEALDKAKPMEGETVLNTVDQIHQ